MKIFSIYDSKAEAYLKPFFAVTRGVALRSFTTACQDESSDFHQYAGDYTLFEIGMFDERTGVLTPSDTHFSLGCAIEFLNVESAAGPNGSPELRAVEGEK